MSKNQPGSDTPKNSDPFQFLIASECKDVKSVKGGLKIAGHGNITGHLKTTHEVLCLRYVKDLGLLAVGFTNGDINIYTSALGTRKDTLNGEKCAFKEQLLPVTCIRNRRYSPPSGNKGIIASYVDGNVKCWDCTKSVCVYSLKEKRQTLGLSYHPNQAKFITVGDDPSVILYNDERATKECEFKPNKGTEQKTDVPQKIFGAAFNEASPFEFVTGGWNNGIHFWDMRQRYAIRSIFGMHICGDGISISPDGRLLLTCSWQVPNPLQLWDYGSGKLIENVEPDTLVSRLYCGQFISNNSAITGGSELHLFRVVDIQNKKTLAAVQGLKAGVYSVDHGVTRYTKRKTWEDFTTQDSSENSDPSNATYAFYKEVSKMPKLYFASGKNIYEYDIKGG